MKAELTSRGGARFQALDGDPILKRFTEGIGLLYFLFILFLVAAFIFEGIVLNLLGKLLELLRYCCRRGWREEVKAEEEGEAAAKEDAREEEGLEVVSNDMAKDLSLAALGKFYSRVKDEYEDFQKIDEKQFPNPRVK